MTNNITGPKNFYYMLNPPKEKMYISKKERPARTAVKDTGKAERIRRLKKEMIQLQIDINNNRKD